MLNGEIPDRRAKLSAVKQALLEKLAQRRATRSDVARGITRRASAAPAPLSLAQQRLWFVDQLEPGSSLYNLSIAVRLTGHLDADALSGALNEIVRRHESLRTSFSMADGRPVQVIGDAAPLDIELEDLRALDAGTREAEVLRRAREEARQPFDLRAGKLLRVRLLRLREEEHVIVLTLHHIITDGWSIDVLLREAATLYEAYSQGRPSPLPELPLQYADFAEWQRRWLTGDVLEQQLSYWRRQLAGAPSMLELPTDRPRPAVQTFRGVSLPVVLPERLTESLKALSQREGVTLFMLLVAAWQVLLARYSGQDDILVGTEVANRTRGETEPLIGFFVNLLVLRTDMGGDPTFLELLRRVKETALAAYAHQDVPFDRLVEELQPERSLSHSPFFQVVFALQNAPAAALEMSGLKLDLIEIDSEKAKFDLALDLQETAGRLAGTLSYNVDLFESSTVGRMAACYRTLLEGIVAEPSRTISELPLLDEDTQREIVVGWNQTATDYPRELCAHQLFERQAESAPEHIALVFDNERLTYGELNERSNQLAHHLRAQGVGPETLVGIMLERSPEMAVSVLAVMKAGGAYLPLDPAYPSERLVYMLSDANVKVLLTQQKAADALPAHGARLVLLDSHRETIAQQSTHNLLNVAAAESVAYAIYTSGSTGRPKGVLVPHRALSNHCAAITRAYQLSHADRVLQFASLSFDVAVEEMFPSWATGATVVLRTARALDSHKAFLDLLAQEQVTVVNLPTAFWGEVMQEWERAGREPQLSLRVAAIGGEKGVAERFAGWRKSLPERARLLNVYGPTETTVTNTFYEVKIGEALPEGAWSVPIGRPIGNTRVYVLDARLRPVPVGVTGELYISGAGVARGYLNRPGLTGERFVPDPYAGVSGERMYRTGDLVRYVAGGSVEFVGRVDEQVKVRGFRVELGEVEAALGAHEGVRECVVIAREEVTGEKRLVAYLVAEEGTNGNGAAAQKVTAGELRAHLKERLPEYMVPTAFVTLERLPCTPNGKLDRRALPAPEPGGGSGREEYAAPRTPVEEVLCGIFAEVLGAERVGSTDDFFDLGGHSLLATQVMSRVREAFRVEVALRALFESPTVAALAVEVERARGASEQVVAPPVVAIGRGGELPLSFAQQRLWFIDQLQPGGTSYNVPAAVRLTGDLDIAALERALSEIVRRHEVLRTTFAEAGGRPVQVINNAEPLRLSVVDLSEVDGGERETRAQELIAEEAGRPFDLSARPLLRAGLIKLDESEHVVMLTMHHIVSDGWSVGVLVREVAALYEAYTQAQESPLAELPVQYADFAVWQREWLTGEVLEAQLSYWRRQLAGAPEVLELPTDRPRPAVRTHDGRTHSFSVAPEITQALRALSRREGVTLYMTLLAAFQTLLHRYSGQEDILIGSPVAGRNRAETEHLIGFFVNTLVLRTDLSGDPSFSELLGRVREVCLGAYAHQDVPFEKLVEELRPERSLSHAPLFQVMFVLQNAPEEELRLGGLRLSTAGAHGGESKFDLTLAVTETADGLGAVLEYDSDLFDAETISRMTTHFLTLLSAAASEPTRQVSELPLLTEDERHALLEPYRTSRVLYATPLCVHEIFEAQTEKSPDAVAVVFENERLTYSELNRRANRLAYRLMECGAGPETAVGLLLERSPDLVVAILATLKAGAAYVPLDLASPSERLAFIASDAALALIVTRAELAVRLPEAGGARLVLLEDEDVEAAQGHAIDNPRRVASPDNLAYVIYTSGSTGRPKGVMVTHRNAARLFEATAAWFGFNPSDRWTLFHSTAFDFSVWELWGALLYGGRLVVVPHDTARSPEEFYELLRRERVTVLNQTPSAFRQLMQHEETTEAASDLSLRLVIFGGEALDLRGLRPWFERHGDAAPQLVNMYGITETTVHVTYRPLAAADADARGSLIGAPIPDLSLFVLDRSMQPVPVGVAGELYVGGAGLARGYLNRPELTAERFVPDPFATEAGARLYKTGDLARFLPDGDVEYLGRADHQVKIRGFRIETGEIEAVLRAHPSVRQAVVLARADAPGETRLVGYVVAAQTDASLKGELHNFCRSKLPDYMVPANFVALEALPLTPNGKLDRRALPAPEADDVAAESYVAPRTPAEQIIAGVFAEVLGLARVGAEDNFFDLGGHSLLATQVMSRVREAFRVEVALRALFESPTVAALAVEVERVRDADGRVSAPPVVAVGREEQLAVSFAQQRLWFIDQLEPGSTQYNLTSAMRLEGQLNIAALERTLSEVVRRHESLRTTFAMADGQPVQIVGEARPVRLEISDLSDLQVCEREARARGLIAEESERPFDLSSGPLLRARLIRLGEQEHVALLTMHHIVSDGWSIGILIREVAALYEAYCEDQSSPLAELPVQYADFAVWQRRWLQGEVLEAQLSYWRRQLAGAPSMLELPTDRPRPSVQTYRGAEHTFVLSAPLTRALNDLSRREGVTLFMTLLAAWQTLLRRYTRQEDIVVGADVANRNRAETEPLIGFFVNMLVLRTDLSGDPTFKELLARVREVCLQAYEHQDVPFERLVEELQPVRDLSHTPLFQTLFVLQNAPMGTLDLPGLKLSVVESESRTTQFDLILDVEESADGLNATLRYNLDLFNASTIERIGRHLSTLLESAVADAEQTVARLRLLPEDERRLVVVGFNETAHDYPREACIHELFEAQAARTPDAVALVCDEERVTYAELNRRANQLAHYLRTFGTGPEVAVGLCLGRSVEMVVGMLGILKAGGTYVPLDASYPIERLAYMMEDAQIQILLTDERNLDELPPFYGHLCCLDTEWDASVAAYSDENPQGGAHADNLAYVMYTSGSTGQPKGVSIPHHGVVRLVKENDYVAFGPKEVFLQLAPVSFDASTFEIWGALLNGSLLALMPPATPTLDQIGEAIERHGVTTLWLTAGLFHLLVDERLRALKPLRQLIAGGDVLSVAHVRRVRAELPALRLVNGYGPTESTTFACCHTICGPEIETSVPIGRPIAQTQVYVLDEQMRPIPLGVAGEFYIGGDGLARGYVNRPELTAERFIPDPFATEAGARLYRTGDLARFLANGTVEFLGRADEQVKIRGFRIETGEVESALLTNAAVREAAVVAREDTPGDKRLVAYVVATTDDAQPTAAQMRAHLKEHLPEYMMPSAFVFLERLPLTPNGKVDRKALPAPEHESANEEGYVAPRTPIEEVLCGIWSEVLGVKQVGVADDFFDLGGHSLLATQVMSRVREALGTEVGLRELFEQPTVADFAIKVERARRGGEQAEAPPIVPVERGDEGLPLSFAQQRLWFIDQLEPASASYNVPAAVRLTGRLDVAALERTLSEIVRRHEVLRTTFDVRDGQPVQVIHDAEPLRFEVLDLSHLADDEREAEAARLTREESQRPFDLAAGPLLRAGLLRLGNEDHVVLLTMHHIIIDGWSMGVLVGEIAALYEAFVEGRPSPLEALKLQYGDFAHWQRRWLRGEVLESHLNYWRRQLGGQLPVLELPTDRPRPAVYSYRGAAHKFTLPATLTTPIEELTRQQGSTLFMTLCSAFQTLLHRYSGQEDILIGTAIANRNRAETENLIGFFVNTLVLRTDLSGDPTFRELLGRVREVCLGAYAHQDVPFEKLVEELQPERSLSHTPLFQVAFGVHNTPLGALQLPDLTLDQMEFEYETGRFDLTLWMSKEADALSGIWYYNTDLFEADTVRRMQGHFETLLQSIARNPDAPLHELDTLTAEEKHQQAIQERRLSESNATKLRTVRRRKVSLPQTPPPQTNHLTDQTSSAAWRPDTDSAN
jgi:amino acid adenylation domain-containing protein